MRAIDPVEKAKEIEKIVLKNNKRRYYRVGRAGGWYGGISTADCCGCNLKCVFCWSGVPRDFPERGKFYSPEEVAWALMEIAKRKNYHLLRVSGNEPAIGKKHLLNLLEILSKEKFLFILETNGTLLDKDFIKDLKIFKKLHIRISLKGSNGDDYLKLTGAIPETFDLIISNIENLSKENLKFNLALMSSFSSPKSLSILKENLGKISKKILENLEEEYVILYPLVKERLKEAGIWPEKFYNP